LRDKAPCGLFAGDAVELAQEGDVEEDRERPSGAGNKGPTGTEDWVADHEGRGKRAALAGAGAARLQNPEETGTSTDGTQ
jgi:hypothetical protein